MKKFKILYFIPLAGLLLAGCSLSEVKGYLRKAKSWAAETVVRPAKDKIDDYVDVDQFFQPDAQQAQKEEEQKSSEKHTHDYGELVAAVEPDCEHDGHLAYYHCEGCGKYFTEGKSETTLEVLTVEALGHVYGNLVAAVDADCEHAGMKAHYECSRCHQLFDAEKNKATEAELVIPAKGHHYGDLVPAVAADCQHDGHAAYYHCDECGKYFTEGYQETTLDALVIHSAGHNYGELVAAVDPDCEHEGHAAYYHCDGCDTYFTADKQETTLAALTVAALGHEYGSLIAKVDADCDHAGSAAHYECSRCHQLFDADKNKVTAEQLVIPALGHQYGDLVPAVEADCTHGGHAAYYHCAECDKYFTADKQETTLDALTVAALGHQVSEHAAKAETCTEAGNSLYYECTRCNKYFSDSACEHEIAADSWVIPAKGHTPVEHAAVAANCTTPGNSLYYECSDCHHYFSDSACQNEIVADSWVISALGHTFDETFPEISTFATYRHEYYHCATCDKLFMQGETAGTYVEIADDAAAWDNSKKQYGQEGFGTEANPYIIAGIDDLLAFREATIASTPDNFTGKFVKLTADIDLDGVTTFTPMSNTDARAFKGTFDGDNHTISNYSYSGNDSVALFSRVTNGTIKNLKLANVNLTTTGTQRTAAIVARASGATIENCEVTSGTISGITQNGGIVAIALAGVTITNCINRASVTGTAGANGGILGYVYNGAVTITGCKNYGAVSGGATDISSTSTPTYVAFLGGILGRVDSTGTHTISNCENHGAITMTASTAGLGVGGIYGTNKDASTMNISGCFNDGAISGKEATGGIMGQLRGAGHVSISNSVNKGDVTAPSLGVAGILGATLANGTSSVSVTGCDNYGAISGSQYVGGIAGLPRKSTAASALVNCRNFGDITATSTACGGVIGLARINVTNCKCYCDANLTFKTTTKKASEWNEIGVSSSAAGYITSGVQTDSSNSNGAVVSGCSLILKETAAYTNTSTTTNMDGTNQAALLGVTDENVTITGIINSGTLNVGLNKAKQIRLYANSAQSLKIEVTNGTIYRIDVAIGGTFNGLTVNGEAVEGAAASTTVSVDINGSVASLANNGASGQTYILSVTIVYVLNS